MALYGSRTYGSFRYAGVPTDINVYPFTAQPLDYGSIKLSWAFPSTTSSFTNFFIVRNSMGFPVTVDDGDLIYKKTYSELSGSSLLGTTASAIDTGAFYSPVNGSISTTNTAISFGNTTNSKTVTLTATPSPTPRTNLITNPSFETNTTGWGSNGSTSLTTTSAYAVSGANSLALSASGSLANTGIYTSSTIAVTAGLSYAWSIYVEQDSNNNLSRNFNAKIEWFDASNNSLSTSVGATTTPDFGNGTFTKVSAIGTAPTNATKVTLSVYTATAPTSGDIYYFDAALFEQTSYVNTYFDGNSTLTNYSFGWNGTANASSSTATYTGVTNASITAGQYVTYTSSGTFTGANSGSGIIGGTRVAAVSHDSTGIYTITLSDYASIPDGTTLTFSSASLALGKTYYYSAFILANGVWQRVGTAISTSIKNYKTADTMYDSLPDIYKLAVSSPSIDGANKNIDLYNFLRTFGVQYDLIKTKVENAKNRYDVSNLDGRLIPALMNEMGFTYESSMGLQQGRRLLKHAINIYLNKGSKTGVQQFASSFTGYAASINPFYNLFLTLDCSSFEAGDGFWNANGTSNTVANTTPANESGLAAYSNAYSPAGYPNSQIGYLKLTTTAASTVTGSTVGITYGVSPDYVTMSSSFTNSSTPGYSYITLNTDTGHGLSVGQTVVIQGMSNTAISSNTGLVNGTWKIIAVPSTTSFTIYVPLITTGSVTVSPTNSYGTVSVYDPKLYGVPVTAGTSYTFSIYSQAKTTSRTITVGINWYDQYGTYLSSSSTGSLANSTSPWLRVGAYNQAAPTGAAYAVPYASITTFASGEIHYFDAAQFEVAVAKTGLSSSGTQINGFSSTTGVVPGSTLTITSGTGSLTSSYVTTVTAVTGTTNLVVTPAPSVALSGATVVFTKPYQDARRVDLYLAPTRINHVINPGFEVNSSTGWTYTGTSATGIDSTNVYPTSSVGSGAAISSNSAKLTSNSTLTTMTSNAILVTPGKAYSLSAYFKSSSAIGMVVSVTWTKSGGGTRVDTSNIVRLSTTAFTRVSLTPTATAMVAPTDAVSATIKFSFGGAPSLIYYVDSVLFEEATSANPYFDGSTGYFNYDDVMWEQNAQGNKGTSNTGRSYYYPNQMLAQARLDTVINDYLPMGTSHALFIGTTAT